MEEPALDSQRSSSVQSFVSTGTAKIKSMNRLTPIIRHLPKPMSSAEILEAHKLPSPDISDSISSTRENVKGQVLERDFATSASSTMGRQCSESQNESIGGGDEVQHDERTSAPIRDVEKSKRQSIIDPSSVRLSFAGSITSLDTPLLLEEGLQKLYRLYQQ